MEKILVTTDLSANSASAIQFACKLSQLKGASLVILHVYSVVKPKTWRSNRFENYRIARTEFIHNKLHRFLEAIFSASQEKPRDLEIDLQLNNNVVTTILDCGRKHKCKYMCVNTHGAGKLKKTIGRTAAKLLTKSAIPIFSIPSAYKEKKLSSCCYASDMINYKREIKKIIELIIPLQLELKILHIYDTSDNLTKSSLLESRLLKRTGVPIKIKYTAKKISQSLSEDIELAVKKIRPSILILFIDRTQKRLNPLLYPEYLTTGSTLFKKIPILTYKK